MGDVDYATPPEWAKLTASTLSQSHIAEFPGIGHGVILADFLIGHCVGQLVGDFIDHPVAAPDMKCLDAFRAAPAGFVTQ